MTTLSRDQLLATLFNAYATFKIEAMECIAEIGALGSGARVRSTHGRAASADNVYRRLVLGLPVLECEGMLLCMEGGDTWFGCFSMERQAEIDHWRAVVTRINPKSESAHTWLHSLPDPSGTEVPCVIREVGEGDLVVLLNPARRLLKASGISPASLDTAWFPIAATFREVVRRFVRVYGWMPMDELAAHWRSLEVGREYSGFGLRSRTTITVSLDLRKSTFAMEQARDMRRYAKWMQDMIACLTKLAKDSGAWFDKFTGDGVLIHYRVDSSAVPPEGRGAQAQFQGDMEATMARAVTCAAMMAVEVTRRLQILRKNLHNDSGLFGAGVGIAVGDADWRFDGDDHLMVVGRGVVWACRVGDKATAGKIRLINSAYQDFRPSELAQRLEFTRKTLESKEFDDGMDVSVWELDAVEVLAAAEHGDHSRQGSHHDVPPAQAI